MWSLRQRLKNAYETNGVKEIIRKTFFYYYYKFFNAITKRKVINGKYEYGLNTTEERDKKVIVSLTSYPARFSALPLCLKSLLMQKIKPDRIIVYLGSDTQEKDITEEMNLLKQYGVEYRIDSTKNLKSYKKFYYSMQEFPNDLIITADDDLFYPDDWVKSLIDSYKKYPDCISGRRVHLMRENDENSFRPYNHWIDQYRMERKPSFALFATSGSGMLFPPQSLPNETFNEKVFMEICQGADDVWLKVMATLNKTKIVWVKNNRVALENTEKEQKSSLTQDNVFLGKNDNYLINLLRMYHLSPKDFK